MTWFAVRHIVRNRQAFEERITLWEADRPETAIAAAQKEALEYAELGDEWELLDLFQSFELEAPPTTSGCEVFSLIRRSDLEPESYATHFFDTGTEYQETTTT